MHIWKYTCWVLNGVKSEVQEFYLFKYFYCCTEILIQNKQV